MCRRQARGRYRHPSKPPAVERVRRWLADGALSLPAHDQLRNELLGFEERVTASGAFTFGARGSGHDDYVSLLITAAMADAKGMIPRGGRARAPAPTLNRIDVTFGIGPYSDLAF